MPKISKLCIHRCITFINNRSRNHHKDLLVSICRNFTEEKTKKVECEHLCDGPQNEVPLKVEERFDIDNDCAGNDNESCFGYAFINRFWFRKYHFDISCKFVLSMFQKMRFRF